MCWIVVSWTEFCFMHHFTFSFALIMQLLLRTVQTMGCEYHQIILLWINMTFRSEFPWLGRYICSIFTFTILRLTVLLSINSKFTTNKLNFHVGNYWIISETTRIMFRFNYSMEYITMKNLQKLTLEIMSSRPIIRAQACIKNSAHRGEVYTPVRQPPWSDTPLGRHHPPPSDGHCSGRYASCWNAFLLPLVA